MLDQFPVTEFFNFLINYRNDKYADVMLFTCNSSEEGYIAPIPAHKLILGTCSHVKKIKMISQIIFT